MALFWELNQQRRIAGVEHDAGRAKRVASQVRTDVGDLERRVERLSLACQALWELLRDTTGLTEEQILEKMTEIDLRDGAADGKMGARTVKCDACGRPGNPQRPVCIYCGADLSRDHVFE